MVRLRLHSRQEGPRFRFEDRHGIIFAREELYRFQGIEKINDYKLHLIAPIGSKHITTPVARHLFETRQNRILQKRLVAIRAFEFRPAPSVPCNHNAPPRQDTPET